MVGDKLAGARFLPTLRLAVQNPVAEVARLSWIHLLCRNSGEFRYECEFHGLP